MADWTLFVTNGEPEVLTWEAVAVLSGCTVAGRTYVQTLEARATGSRHTRRDDRGRELSMVSVVRATARGSEPWLKLGP